MPGVRSLGSAATLAAVMMAIAPASGSASRPLVTGIDDLNWSFSAGDAASLRQAKRTGASFVRFHVGWDRIAPPARPLLWNPANPTDPGYDWSHLDRAVRAAVNAGLTPMLQVVSVPSWAERCESERSPGPVCDPNPSDLRDFALAAARRYSGEQAGIPRVRYWVAMNEPNLVFFFEPQYQNGRPVSPGLYRALVNAFATSVHSVKADNRVLNGGLAPLGHETESVVPPLEFMRRLLCMEGRRRPHPVSGCGSPVQIDIWATNPYTTGSPTHQGPRPDDVSLGDLPEMTRLLRAAERADHLVSNLPAAPFWVLEFSYDSKPADPHGLPLRRHARWVSEALYRAWSAGVSGFFWLALRDEPRGVSYRESIQGGLYFLDDRPKRALKAFRFPVVAFPRRAGLFVWGRTPYSQRGVVTLELWDGRRWRGFARLRANRFGIFVHTERTRYGRHNRGAVRAVSDGEPSLPFSMLQVPDYYVRPFG